MPLQVLQPFEWTLAELVRAHKDLFALLEIAPVRCRRLVALALDAGQWTSFTIVATWCISFAPVDRRFRNR